jgi:hypothetical protein
MEGQPLSKKRSSLRGPKRLPAGSPKDPYEHIQLFIIPCHKDFPVAGKASFRFNGNLLGSADVKIEFQNRLGWIQFLMRQHDAVVIDNLDVHRLIRRQGKDVEMQLLEFACGLSVFSPK